MKQQNHNNALKRKIYYNLQNFYFFKYHSCFFGSLITCGKKIQAFKFFNNIKYELKLKENIEPNILFYLSMLKLTPHILLFPFKVGGQLQKVPLPIGWKKKVTFAVKWVIKLLRDKFKKVTLLQVTELMISAIYNKGLGYERKKAYHKLGKTNRFLIKRFK